MLRAIILSLFVIVQVSAQWEWKGNSLPIFNNQGWALDAYDSLNAVIAVLPQVPPFDYNLFITTDGGNNWKGSELGKWIIDVSMTSPEKIWFCTAEPNEIWRTIDGGLNWIKLLNADTLTSFFNYIKMFDDNNGIAMGDAPDSTKPLLLMKTTDGGINWDVVNSDFLGGFSGDVWRRICFPDINTGYLVPNTQKLLKTTNGGYSWIEVPGINLICVLNFFNEDNGLLSTFNCGNGNFIYKTTDGGINWDSSYLFTDPSNIKGYGIDFEFLPEDPSKVWFTTLDSLYFTSDSGRTWTKDNLSESFTKGRDLKIVDGKVCWFLCETVYRNLNANTIVNVYNGDIPPSEFQLLQNYPNPFNSQTIINFSLPVKEFVKLKIYDLLGNEIQTLVNEEKSAGNYEVNFEASGLASGIYFYRIKIGDFVKTKKLILLK